MFIALQVGIMFSKGIIWSKPICGFFLILFCSLRAKRHVCNLFLAAELGISMPSLLGLWQAKTHLRPKNIQEAQSLWCCCLVTICPMSTGVIETEDPNVLMALDTWHACGYKFQQTKWNALPSLWREGGWLLSGSTSHKKVVSCNVRQACNGGWNQVVAPEKRLHKFQQHWWELENYWMCLSAFIIGQSTTQFGATAKKCTTF